jgi:hypothetical protein
MTNAEHARDLSSRLALAEGRDVLVDLGFLDEGVENVEHAVRAPYLLSMPSCNKHRAFSVMEPNWTGDGSHLAALGEHDQLVFRFTFGLGSPDAEGLELIDELVDDVPEPLFGELEGDRGGRVFERDQTRRPSEPVK